MGGWVGGCMSAAPSVILLLHVILTYPHVSSRTLTYPHVSSRILTNAGACRSWCRTKTAQWPSMRRAWRCVCKSMRCV